VRENGKNFIRISRRGTNQKIKWFRKRLFGLPKKLKQKWFRRKNNVKAAMNFFKKVTKSY